MQGFKKRVLPVIAFIVCLAVIGVVGKIGYDNLYGPQPAPKHLQLTEKNFKDEITSKGLVYFYVCSKDRYACEVQSKAFDEFADKYGAQVKVAYVDASTQAQLVQALGITSPLELPAHFVVADGKPIGSFTGVFSADELASLISQIVQNPQQPQDSTQGTSGGSTTGGTTDGGTKTDGGTSKTAAPTPSTTPDTSGK